MSPYLDTVWKVISYTVVHLWGSVGHLTQGLHSDYYITGILSSLRRCIIFCMEVSLCTRAGKKAPFLTYSEEEHLGEGRWWSGDYLLDKNIWEGFARYVSPCLTHDYYCHFDSGVSLLFSWFVWWPVGVLGVFLVCFWFGLFFSETPIRCSRQSTNTHFLQRAKILFSQRRLTATAVIARIKKLLLMRYTSPFRNLDVWFERERRNWSQGGNDHDEQIVPIVEARRPGSGLSEGVVSPLSRPSNVGEPHCQKRELLGLAWSNQLGHVGLICLFN